MRLVLTIILWLCLMLVTFFAWDKAKKWKAQKRKDLAIEKAKGATAAIALYCSANTSKMISAVEDLAYLCRIGVEKDSDIIALYDSEDYLAFAYRSALRYASQYVEDDPERIAIEKYCEPEMNYLAKLHRTLAYKDRG